MFHAKTGSIVVSKKKVSVNNLSTLISSSLITYSLRLINSNYTGKCIKVKRDSDNTTQDIGFVAGTIDTTSLLNFVGGGNGFLDTFYDQSGNNYNIFGGSAGSSSLPKIVSNGSLVTYNSKPALNFNGSQFYYYSEKSYAYCSLPSNTLTSVTSFTQNAVGQGEGVLITVSGSNDGNQNSCLGAANTVQDGNIGPWYGGYNQGGAFIATSYNNINNNVLTKTYDGSTINGYVNGANAFTASGIAYSLTTSDILLGVQNTYGLNVSFNGYLQEATVFLRTLSDTDRQLLEQNQEAYYGITGI
jgi:hypothetical protein